MSDKTTCPVELYQADIEYLQQIVKRYQLADLGKAIRCLVNFARDEKEYEQKIFEEIRCPHC